MKILRGHMEDVYDLSWSPDSLSLVSGSVDNTAMVWSVETGKSLAILSDHKGFVQGVAWDPANQYIATMCTDRHFRIFDCATRRIICRSNKCLLPVPESCELFGKITRLYHDDTLQTFYRRLSFSPDSELIVTPAGTCDQDAQNVSQKPLHFSYIYTRQSLKQPVAILPSTDFTVCIKFCPKLFQLRTHTEEVNPPFIPLPYRMVFAVATKSSVFLYDTQQPVPFAVISNIHYTRLTDVAWSGDGRILIVSSTDGFCSLVTFAEQELGDVYDDTEVMEKLREASNAKAKKPSKKKKMKKKAPSNNSNEEKTKESPKADSSSPQLPTSLPAVVMNDTEILSKIIKSDERFSPSKKDRPLTPIAIRRHPRHSIDSPASGGDEMQTSKPKTPKTPTPIAFRRQPRSLIPAVCEEAAVDAWPIGTEKPMAATLVKQDSVEKIVCDGDMLTTSDIRLVLDVDSQDEEMEGVETTEQKKSDDAKKTPRRVPLITLSTPKSKTKPPVC